MDVRCFSKGRETEGDGITYNGQVLQRAVDAKGAELGELHQGPEGALGRAIAKETVVGLLETGVEIEETEVPPAWSFINSRVDFIIGQYVH